MKISTAFSAVVLAFFGAAAVVSANGSGAGWGDNVDWKPLDDGLRQAAQENRGAVIIIWKSWCGACKNLKPLVAQSAELARLSSNFVMIQAGDDAEPKDSQFSPDGGYYPRILFTNPAGSVLTDIYNKAGSPQYKYYYSSAEQIVDSMVEASSHLSGIAQGAPEL